MDFKGDIIITDPCYIMGKDSDWDKCGNGDNMEALGITHYLCADTEYGDWGCVTIKDVPNAPYILGKLSMNYAELWDKSNSIKKDETAIKTLTEKRDKIINESGIILGRFCADAGLVAVFLLDEVLKYNPKFDYHITRPHTTTLIKDFDGDIEITHRGDDNEVSVIGEGNISFYTTQTEL